MRNLAALVLVLAALCACGADPLPSCGAPGLARSCPCPGGAQGAQECGPGGAWEACVCADGGAAEAGVDAGRDAAQVDAAHEAATDAPPADAAEDTAGDARPPTEDRLDDGGCPGGFAQCVGVTCVNLMTSRMWCGDCRAVCGAQSECIGGRCVSRASGVSCGPGQGDCDGVAANGCEVDTWTDRANCGGCGRACAANETRCADGACLPR